MKTTLFKRFVIWIGYDTLDSTHLRYEWEYKVERNGKVLLVTQSAKEHADFLKKFRRRNNVFTYARIIHTHFK